MAKKSFDLNVNFENGKVKVTTTVKARKGMPDQATWIFTRKFVSNRDAEAFVNRIKGYALTGPGRPVNSAALNAVVAAGLGGKAGKNLYRGPNRPASQVRAA